MISISNLSMRFGSKVLFKNASLQLNPGCHYGLVGANGSGKSTLIKILSGEVPSETGEINIPSQSLLGVLRQNHFSYENMRIIDLVMMGKAKLWEALQQKQLLLQQNNFSEADCTRLDDLEKQISAQQGYAAESQAAKLLEGLGIYDELHFQPLRTLSGGYKLRVLLAQLLFSEPDILLLDEPTNHLDIFSIKWLEEYLKQFPGTLLVSSHDRHFLNGISTHIIDVDYETIKIYKGNYDSFQYAKEENRTHQENFIEKQLAKKEHLQRFKERFGAKATKARQAQSKARFAEQIQDEIDSLEHAPSSRIHPQLYFQQTRPSGAIALTVKTIEKSYGTKKVLTNVSFTAERGERIAFLGANGIGKTTLLEILTGHLTPCSGEFQWGFASQHSYFPQDPHREVDKGLHLLDWLRQFQPEVPEEHLREILALAMFSGDDVKKSTSILSGGETARLILAKIMLLKSNVLIFDEPTNHLDMEAIEALLAALENYEGTLLLVSHNRYFISRIANRIIEITQKGLLDFRCNYEEYLAQREKDLLLANLNQRRDARTENSVSDQKAKHAQQKMQRNLKAQLEKKTLQAEQKCLELEQKIQIIDQKFSQENFYHTSSKEQQQELLNQKKLLEIALEKSMQDWEDNSLALSEIHKDI